MTNKTIEKVSETAYRKTVTTEVDLSESKNELGRLLDTRDTLTQAKAAMIARYDGQLAEIAPKIAELESDISAAEGAGVRELASK